MKIEIRCKAKVLLPIDLIESIQGDLKSISHGTDGEIEKFAP
jgi:hypothetical protein